jgi:NAD-dependent dihydropyrimidine dehydrogenase PreA subunit
MGLAEVNEQTCLPLANREACQLCVDECNAAGYEAIEFMRVHTQVDSNGMPVESSGHLAPVVAADKCVGCGLCQTRCYGINVKTKQLLAESAIVIQAGNGKEDRLLAGSYQQLRAKEAERRATGLQENKAGDFYVPGTQHDSDAPPEDEEPESPF